MTKFKFIIRAGLLGVSTWIFSTNWFINPYDTGSVQLRILCFPKSQRQNFDRFTTTVPDVTYVFVFLFVCDLNHRVV